MLLCIAASLSGQSWEIVENSASRLSILIQFPDPEASLELEELRFVVGLPSSTLPQIRITSLQSVPFQPSLRMRYHFEPTVAPARWERRTRFRDLNVGILKISPLVGQKRDLAYIQQARVTVLFSGSRRSPGKVGLTERTLYKHAIVNWDVARGWMDRPSILRKRRGARGDSLTGEWYRIPVEEDGIYGLSASTLQSAGMNIQNVNPSSLRMYTNPQGGRPMSQVVGETIPRNLVEVARKIKGGEDGTFDESDAIVFYGRGPRGFDSTNANDVTFTQNPYTNENIYWLNVPDDPTVEGKRVEWEDEAPDDFVLLDYGVAYLHLEEDMENPFESGLLWVGAGVTRNQTVSTILNLHHPKKEVSASIDFSIFGGTSSESEERPSHFAKIYQRSTRDTLLVSQSWSGLSVRKLSADLDASMLLDGANNFILVENASPDNASKVFLDWSTVKYGQELVWEDRQFEFWAPSRVEIIRFALSQVNSDVDVWDITDFANPVEEAITLSGNKMGYFEKTVPENRLARFIVFNDKELPQVTTVIQEIDQRFSTLRKDIYPIDHVIITPDEFLTAAEKLRQHRKNSVVAPLSAIYDEFSGGVHDPLAIRYFLKWTKEHWRNPTDHSFPSFVLLFGDGDYDYRNISGNSHNLVPTFQSSSVRVTSSDDRFAYLDGGVPEMAIGRFPAVTLSDAVNMVDKTIAYETDPDIGLWRRRVTLVADDFARPNFGSIELTHTKNSESVAAMIPRTLEVHKLYMEEYPPVNDGSQYGVTKPGATEALFDVLERGTVLLNYIGHGSAYQWAQEGLLSSARGDLSSINTGMKLPIWVAGTCSWGRYDKVEGSAMSEDILRVRDKGGVAIISTNGLITFSANRSFILKLFGSFFPSGNVGDAPLGALYSAIKDGSSGSEMFHLFGDPALKIALSPNWVTVKNVSPDTLVALKTGSFSGEVGSDAPSKGEGYVVLYDADRTITRTYVQGQFTEDITYTLLGRTLFRGKLPYSGETYRGEFILPKDINYATSDGRLAVYLFGKDSDGLWEGLGVREGLVLKGGTTNPDDSQGPLISFALENRIVEWGDHLPEDGELVIKLSDPLGINVTDEVGHAIRLWLNDDEQSAVTLTDRFLYDSGSYNSGSLPFSLSELPRGNSLITVEAWDNANNPSRVSVSLNVTSTEKLTLTNVFNYPNPFKRKTQFGFEVNREATVSIKIFTLSGQLVRKLEPMEIYVGYAHVDWNGRDDFGDEIANGAYLYQIIATPVDGGKKANHIGKVAKYR